VFGHRLVPDAPPVPKPAPQFFNHVERIRGNSVNVLQGLALHREVLSVAEQRHVLEYVSRLNELGMAKQLVGRTYTAPNKWKRGKGRITLQLGCCYNYASDRDGNPPGILRDYRVCGMPKLLNDVIDRMVARGIFNAKTRPDSCIINYYSEGDCIPPHIDSHDFCRPFVTLSLLSEQSILFGQQIAIVSDGEFDAPVRLPLPKGSVLVLDGNGADVAKHCVPAVTADRISITFRKIGAKASMTSYEGPDGAGGGPKGRQLLSGR